MLSQEMSILVTLNTGESLKKKYDSRNDNKTQKKVIVPGILNQDFILFNGKRIATLFKKFTLLVIVKTKI